MDTPNDGRREPEPDDRDADYTRIVARYSDPEVVAGALERVRAEANRRAGNEAPASSGQSPSPFVEEGSVQGAGGELWSAAMATTVQRVAVMAGATIGGPGQASPIGSALWMDDLEWFHLMRALTSGEGHKEPSRAASASDAAPPRPASAGSSGGTAAVGASSSVLELLPMVFATPDQALAKAEAVLTADPRAVDASVAHQVIGIWQRDFGNMRLALQHLRRACDLASRADSTERQVDALSTLGVALIHAGRTRQGLDALDQSVERGRGHARARVLHRRAYARWVLGRHREALEDVRRAIPVLRQANDVIWTARALTLRATLHLTLGSVDRAHADFTAAEALWDTTGQKHDKADTVESRGLAAFRSGDIPAALRLLDEAEEQYARLGAPTFLLRIRRCEVLMAAGLAAEALAEADAAIAALDRVGGQSTRKSELLLAAARAALLAGDPQTAITRAARAVRLFAGQRRGWWEAHARLVGIEARVASGRLSGRLIGQAATVAEQLAQFGAPAAPEASLLAGRVALGLGWTADAERHLAVAARSRHRGPVLARLTGWTAQALRAQAAGSRRGVLEACRRGLDVLDAHRMTLGASEWRARAIAQGTELAALAQQVSLHSGGPRQLLVWSERWRATVLSTPPTRPPDDPELLAALTAFREIAARAEAARMDGRAIPALEREQRRLEWEIRSRTLKTRGSAPDASDRFDPRRLLEDLGTGQLVELTVLDGRVQVLLCGQGRVRRFEAGLLTEAQREAEHVQAGLRRLAHPGNEARLALVEAAGRRLEELLLGPAADHLGAGPVVVVPPGRLPRVPWALLPSLRERVHSVSPSASSWLRARETEPPQNDRHVLVRGPGSVSSVRAPGPFSPHSQLRVLQHEDASVSRVLQELDGAALAHIDAHGTFRADSPLFSSLRMADGPLIVHDFERLDRSPYRIILSGSETARLAPVAADEMLSLVAALLPLGTAGVVASNAPVNDDAALPLMLALHEGLAAGLSLAEALRKARATLPTDTVHQATGWAFTAFGTA